MKTVSSGKTRLNAMLDLGSPRPHHVSESTQAVIRTIMSHPPATVIDCCVSLTCLQASHGSTGRPVHEPHEPHTAPLDASPQPLPDDHPPTPTGSTQPATHQPHSQPRSHKRQTASTTAPVSTGRPPRKRGRHSTKHAANPAPEAAAADRREGGGEAAGPSVPAAAAAPRVADAPEAPAPSMQPVPPDPCSHGHADAGEEASCMAGFQGGVVAHEAEAGPAGSVQLRPTNTQCNSLGVAVSS